MNSSIKVFKEFLNSVPTETGDAKTETNAIFQQILNKFEPNSRNEVVNEDFINRKLSVCNELIDTVEKVTFSYKSDFQSFPAIFSYIGSVFRVINNRNIDSILMRQTFFGTLDVLVKPQICSYLNNNQDLQPSHKAIYKCITSFLICGVHPLLVDLPLSYKDSSVRKYSDLLIGMYRRVECDLQVTIHNEQSMVRDNTTSDTILSFICSLSDRVIIVPWLLDIGLVKSMLECLQSMDMFSANAVAAVGIIHNISRHDDGAVEINNFDGLQILKNIQNENNFDSHLITNLLISMAIALLSTPKQIRSDNKRMNKILNRLLEITIEAASVSLTGEKTKM